MLIMKTIAVMTAATLCLAACGKSGDARKAEAVKCGAFFQSFAEATLGGDAAMDSFVKELNTAAVGHPSNDGLKLQGLVSLGEQVAPQVEAVKREAAQQDGLQDIVKFARAKDAHGAVLYLDECVDNRDRLLAAAR
jgi:hypothetical protein